MNWFAPFARRRSASVARERLQILLTHERGADGQPDLIPKLREEVLAAVARHVPIEPDKVQVKIERGKGVSLLEIDIEIPGLGAISPHVTQSVGRKISAGGRQAVAKPA